MSLTVPPAWAPILEPVLAEAETATLLDWVAGREATGTPVYPPSGLRLRALALTPPEAVRVVILGQDPYHGPGQAHGLAFSVPHGVRLPPSLRNIYRELEADLGVPPRTDGDLERWARQGVLLLNTSLSVEEGKAGSHSGKGWERVTDACIAAVADSAEPVVFILWGRHAQAKRPLIEQARNGARHCILESVHPSPLSARRGFFGSRPFSRANAFLKASGRGEVEW